MMVMIVTRSAIVIDMPALLSAGYEYSKKGNRDHGNDGFFDQP